jgi:hypothetical protein
MSLFDKYNASQEKEEGKLKLIPRIILHGGNVSDAITTLDALHNGQLEGNPIYGNQPSDLRILGTKIGTSLLTDYLLSKIAKQHPKLANGMAIGSGIGLGLIAAHNNSISRKK